MFARKILVGKIHRATVTEADVDYVGSITIDLDLLVYGAEVVDEPGLRVPHRRLHERRFVLEPLLDLDPDLVVPGRGRVDELLARLG